MTLTLPSWMLDSDDEGEAAEADETAVSAQRKRPRSLLDSSSDEEEDVKPVVAPRVAASVKAEPRGLLDSSSDEEEEDALATHAHGWPMLAAAPVKAEPGSTPSVKAESAPLVKAEPGSAPWVKPEPGSAPSVKAESAPSVKPEPAPSVKPEPGSAPSAKPGSAPSVEAEDDEDDVVEGETVSAEERARRSLAEAEDFIDISSSDDDDASDDDDFFDDEPAAKPAPAPKVKREPRSLEELQRHLAKAACALKARKQDLDDKKKILRDTLGKVHETIQAAADSAAAAAAAAAASSSDESSDDEAAAPAEPEQPAGVVRGAVTQNVRRALATIPEAAPAETPAPLQPPTRTEAILKDCIHCLHTRDLRAVFCATKFLASLARHGSTWIRQHAARRTLAVPMPVAVPPSPTFGLPPPPAYAPLEAPRDAGAFGPAAPAAYIPVDDEPVDDDASDDELVDADASDDDASDDDASDDDAAADPARDEPGDAFGPPPPPGEEPPGEEPGGADAPAFESDVRDLVLKTNASAGAKEALVRGADATGELLARDRRAFDARVELRSETRRGRLDTGSPRWFILGLVPADERAALDAALAPFQCRASSVSEGPHPPLVFEGWGVVKKKSAARVTITLRGRGDRDRVDLDCDLAAQMASTVRELREVNRLFAEVKDGLRASEGETIAVGRNAVKVGYSRAAELGEVMKVDKDAFWRLPEELQRRVVDAGLVQLRSASAHDRVHVARPGAARDPASKKAKLTATVYYDRLSYKT